jgi:hypothetical protein
MIARRLPTAAGALPRPAFTVPTFIVPTFIVLKFILE